MFFYLKNERIAHSLFFGEWCEWIAQVTHHKWVMWAILSESLRSLTKNKRIAHLLILGKKRAIRLEKQMSEFPALIILQ